MPQSEDEPLDLEAECGLNGFDPQQTRGQTIGRNDEKENNTADLAHGVLRSAAQRNRTVCAAEDLSD